MSRQRLECAVFRRFPPGRLVNGTLTLLRQLLGAIDDETFLVELTLVTQYVTVRGVIRGFADRETERIWNERVSRRFPTEMQQRALNKLALLNRATRLEDLRVPPGNRLESLRGRRDGQHSIRINDQWRLCFRWEAGDAFDVEICDYH